MTGQEPEGIAARDTRLAEALLDLQRLTERLRRDCPWDREQTARTIVPHTVEEAYEVADAALADDAPKLLDELGDLLFQVYFLALLLEEDGQGDLEEVARGIQEKLVRRHPHVFGDTEAETAGRVRENWERIKREQEGREGIFHEVPEALPALMHARKVQRRAASVGFEYPDAAGGLADPEDRLAGRPVSRDERADGILGDVEPELVERIRTALDGIGDVESLVAGDWLRLKRLGLSDVEIAAASWALKVPMTLVRNTVGLG